MKNIFPLADKLRPTSLDTFEGQDHLVKKGTRRKKETVEKKTYS